MGGDRRWVGAPSLPLVDRGGEPFRSPWDGTRHNGRNRILCPYTPAGRTEASLLLPSFTHTAPGGSTQVASATRPPISSQPTTKNYGGNEAAADPILHPERRGGGGEGANLHFALCWDTPPGWMGGGSCQLFWPPALGLGICWRHEYISIYTLLLQIENPIQSLDFKKPSWQTYRILFG